MVNKKYSKPKITENKLRFNLFYSSSKNIDQLVSPWFESSVLLAYNCFPSSTQVLTGDNKWIFISALKKDQELVTYDIQNNMMQKQQIQAVIIHPKNLVGHYIINGNFKATGNHRVWTSKKKWVRVDDLQLGDQLLSSDNRWEQVQLIKKIMKAEPVYNLSISGTNHNFFADKFLVHNTGCCGSCNSCKD